MQVLMGGHVAVFPVPKVLGVQIDPQFAHRAGLLVAEPLEVGALRGRHRESSVDHGNLCSWRLLHDRRMHQSPHAETKKSRRTHLKQEHMRRDTVLHRDLPVRLFQKGTT